jgi:von Willebrand factor type A domain
MLLVTLHFLTPRGALLALVVLLPLAAFLGVSRRATRVRRALGVPELPESARLVPLVAVLAVGGLLGLAAAQPLVERTSERKVRSDAEAFVVLDVSRSMLARQGLQGTMRFDRAKQAAEQLRASLPDVRVGIASLTNRVLPHLFPSADEDVFRATLEKSVGIERPAPGTGFIIAPGQVSTRNATTFSALAGMGTQGFFSPEARRRVVVVLTDGESPDVSAGRVGASFRRAGIQAVFLRFWGARERVFTNDEAEPQYRPQPESRAILESLATATGGSVFDEGDLAGVERQVHQDIGTGSARAVQLDRGRRLPLAPYLAAVAFLPLGLLLWRRDR